jgi:hypothetical protein
MDACDRKPHEQSYAQDQEADEAQDDRQRKLSPIEHPRGDEIVDSQGRQQEHRGDLENKADHAPMPTSTGVESRQRLPPSTPAVSHVEHFSKCSTIPP